MFLTKPRSKAGATLMTWWRWSVTLSSFRNQKKILQRPWLAMVLRYVSAAWDCSRRSMLFCSHCSLSSSRIDLLKIHCILQSKVKFVTFVNVSATPDIFCIPSYFRTCDLISDVLKLLWCEFFNVHVHSNICQGLVCTLVALPFALQISGQAAQGFSVFGEFSCCLGEFLVFFGDLFTASLLSSLNWCLQFLNMIYYRRQEPLIELPHMGCIYLHMIGACLSYNYTSHSRHCRCIIWIGVQWNLFKLWCFLGVG